jgi:hypothetical protein
VTCVPRAPLPPRYDRSLLPHSRSSVVGLAHGVSCRSERRNGVGHISDVVHNLGNFSQQIDVVVFDRQYSPFIFTYENEAIIPAECVYATFVYENTSATALLFKLTSQLQFSGTVPMIDVEAYGQWLEVARQQSFFDDVIACPCSKLGNAEQIELV